jgi:hypothetical protein
VGKQKFLSLVPNGAFDDRLMLARISCTLVPYLADIDGIAQQGIERAPREGLEFISD